MKDIIARYNLHARDISKLNKPSLELQLENTNNTKLSKDVAEKTHQLRRMKGEDLDGLKIEELVQLEKMLETGLSRVIETKENRIMSEITALQKKGTELIEENKKLKHKMDMLCRGKIGMQVVDTSEIGMQEEGVSSELSMTTNVCSCNSGPPLDDDSSDTSLKLG
ncbi:MADS-box protein SVP-like [Senna tora]|uniref:MADS-box protein SVP-like n=1 Tax=Senna tora TaxID=362788 RepID=A0A834U3T7_9FABA|nr:MADS-box protein SVP-like [Senna tora]